MDEKSFIITQLETEYSSAQKKVEIIRGALDAQKLYADFGGAFHLLKQGRNGDVTPVRLCNFTAEIEHEIVKNDGRASARYFRVSGRLAHGEALPEIDILASEFDRLDWLTSAWGSSAQIVVGTRHKDHVLAAIKERSEPKIEQINQHTGWVQLGDELIYLTGSGGIGVEGLRSDASCELQGSLSDFHLPEPTDPETLVLEELLHTFQDVHKENLGLILLGAAMRATLCHFEPAKFSIYLQGVTGTFKSALAGVLQAFWGSQFDGANLPANWSSTGNALEKIAFLAKDALLVTDDFVARGTRQEVARTHANAERLLRAQGNQSGRTRLNSKAELRNAFYPRGIVLATGEDLPNGHSLQARLVYLNISKGAINVEALSKLQKCAKNGMLAKTMASFIKWLAADAKSGTLHEFIQNGLECDRENIGRQGHARTQDNLANVLTGLRIFLEFCEEVGGISAETKEQFLDLAIAAATNLANLQATLDHEASEAQRYLDLIRTAISSGKAHIECCTGGTPSHARSLGWRNVHYATLGSPEPMGQQIGWIDNSHLYLEPGSSLSVVKSLSTALDNHLGSSERAISKCLKEAGLLVRSEKGRNTAKVSILGARRNVYVLNIEDVFDLDIHTDVPIEIDESEIPF